MCDADAGTLAALVEKSLLVRQHGRFALLETIREYALERLRQEHDEAAARRRHADYFVGLAVQARPEIRARRCCRLAGTARRGARQPGAALEWSLEHDPAAFLRAIDALYLFWYIRGHYREGTRWYDRARTIAEGDAEPGARADVLKLGAALAYASREFPLARSLIDQALPVYRSLDDAVNTVRALTLLGLISTGEGEHDAAVALLEESTALAREPGNEKPCCRSALANLGYAALTTGDLERAYSASLEAVELHRSKPQPGNVSRARSRPRQPRSRRAPTGPVGGGPCDPLG